MQALSLIPLLIAVISASKTQFKSSLGLIVNTLTIVAYLEYATWKIASRASTTALYVGLPVLVVFTILFAVRMKRLKWQH